MNTYLNALDRIYTHNTYSLKSSFTSQIFCRRLFCGLQKNKIQNISPYRSFFRSAFLFRYSLCSPLHRHSFPWNCGCLIFLERGKFNLIRVLDDGGFFSPKELVFWVQLCQVWTEFPKRFKCLLNLLFTNLIACWSGKENMHRSLRNENDQSSRQRGKSLQCFNVLVSTLEKAYGSC